ncbi:MAG: redoxin domain-containing protein [Candidatus Latescibacteria bacterium]|nr:redoxin domain-containing protein [Candidatus Latescibacterota bacterium]
MQEHLDAYAERNATIIAVGARQQLCELREYAERNGITFPLLADGDWSAIRSYGVHHWFGLALHNFAYYIVRPATSIFGNPGRSIHGWTGLADHGLSNSIARPATFIVDRRGVIRYTYIGSSQFDLPEQSEILDHLDSLTS